MRRIPYSFLGWLVASVATLASLHLSAQVTLTSSNLPIIVINTTNNQVIPDNPKIMADMGIIYNGTGNRNYMTDPFNNYNGKIGIEVRGSSSQIYYPKKSYGVELWDVNGNAIDTTILGMPAENDWCLIANYIDKSLLNNSITYHTWEEMGWWGPRHKEVELVINGTYMGEYLIVEKIKRDSARVHISKILPTDISGDELTGGYIVAIDQYTGSTNYSWTSSYVAYGMYANGYHPNFICVYPDGNDIQPQQSAYITAYVDSFETAIIANQFDTATGWQKYADINSFVDYFLIQEFSRNVDGYRASTYFYKDKDSKGGKLTMGCVWDYDRGWGNASYAYGNLTAGWDWPFGDNYSTPNPLQVPEWWHHLLMDTSFTKALRCRWEQLKTNTLSISHLQGYCDSMAVYLNESQQRNFTTWPILGVQIFPNPLPVPATYQGEIDEIKNWIQNRWGWLDMNIPGVAINCQFVGITENSSAHNGLHAYPNPVVDQLQLYLDEPLSGSVIISVMDVAGREVRSEEHVLTAEQSFSLNRADLSNGIYFVQVRFEDRIWIQRIVKQ